MQLSEAVLGRRSIRKFKNQPVPEKDILEIIRLASHAPSAGNQQMWHFTVVGVDIKASLASVINEAFKERVSEAGAEDEVAFLGGGLRLRDLLEPGAEVHFALGSLHRALRLEARHFQTS